MTINSIDSAFVLSERGKISSSNSHPALIGYWHNWHMDNAAFVPLRNVSPNFDIINIAFAVEDSRQPGRLVFEPCQETTFLEFKSDIAALKNKGKKVLLSVGGAGISVSLENADQFLQFHDSLEALLDLYGFDGVDIDLEGTLHLQPGDVDFAKPVSSSVLYLIEALRKIKNRRGDGFMISLAPQINYVQGGFCAYEGVQGSYLSVIDNLRDVLDYVHVQHYNASAQKALDGQTYAPDGLDFHVAMAEMLLNGFHVGGRQDHFFCPLQPGQLSIGLSSRQDIVQNGYISLAELPALLGCLSGKEDGLSRYRLQNQEGYPGFGALMTWSINWDAADDFAFSSLARQELDALLK
jgi:chitinase